MFSYSKYPLFIKIQIQDGTQAIALHQDQVKEPYSLI